MNYVQYLKVNVVFIIKLIFYVVNKTGCCFIVYFSLSGVDVLALENRKKNKCVVRLVFGFTIEYGNEIDHN